MLTDFDEILIKIHEYVWKICLEIVFEIVVS